MDYDIPNHLEYDFNQELSIAPENVEAAVELWDELVDSNQTTFLCFTQTELCARQVSFLKAEIERKRHSL